MGTNGWLRATPHRVALTSHPRNSIIRFNAVMASVVVEPLSHFITDERPAQYSPVTMDTHMRTTMKNLQSGKGSWDPLSNSSRSAAYQYGCPNEAYSGQAHPTSSH